MSNEGPELSSHSDKPLRILLVEDHDDTRLTLSRLLTHFGHQISVAASKQVALELIAAKNFDVVLSDIALPDGDGYDVISHAKQKQAVKGVALTGFEPAHRRDPVGRTVADGVTGIAPDPVVNIHHATPILERIKPFLKVGAPRRGYWRAL